MNQTFIKPSMLSLSGFRLITNFMGEYFQSFYTQAWCQRLGRRWMCTHHFIPPLHESRMIVSLARKSLLCQYFQPKISEFLFTDTLVLIAYGVLYIKYATFLLQQMTVEIDEDFIFALLDFSKLPGASWSSEREDVLCDETLDIPEPSSTEAGQDVYFELLHIQPAQMDLSFVRTERINAEDKTSSRNPLMFFINVLTMAIGNINDAPVKLNALLLENVRVSVPILLQRIQGHYSQEFLYQVHKILGSADFLGNPVGLFNNISSGVMDIFYEPYQGFVMTDRPQELGIGIAKGATSFVKKSVFGVTDSFSKVTGSISKGNQTSEPYSNAAFH